MDKLNPNELPSLGLEGIADGQPEQNDPTAVDREIQLELEYGDKPIEAAVGQAVSTATFGASDVLARAAGVSPERLREVRERSPIATGVGTVGGIVAPAIATAGTSAAAQAVAAPARALTAAGLAAEQAALKTAQKIATKELGKNAARTVGLAARGGAEGAALGAGQVVSDVALQKPDLSAESAIATVGHGALFGVGFGAALGTAAATAPFAGRGMKRVFEGVKGTTKQAIDPFVDPAKAVIGNVSGSAAQAAKLEQRLGNAVDDLPTYYKQDLGVGDSLIAPTNADLLKRNSAVVRQTGKQIDELVTRIDDQITAQGATINRDDAFAKLFNRIDARQAELQRPGLRSINSAKLDILESFKKDLLDYRNQARPFSFKELNDLRKAWDEIKYPMDRSQGAETFRAQVAEDLRQEARNILDETAVAATGTTVLRDLNRKYFIGKRLEPALKWAADRAPDLSSPLAIVSSVVGRNVRHAAILSDIAAKTASVREQIAKSVNAAITNTQASSKLDLPATRVLVSSGFAMSEDGKKPKTAAEGFQNVQRNLQDAADPDRLVELIARKTARVQNAAPEIGMAMQERLATGIQFLNSKLPKPAVRAGIFQRPYAPSSIELAKFQRYLQIVEQPLTALKELEQGTLTREHVEALQAVYPEIYKEIQVAVMDKISTSPTMPYSRRIQLGILLGIPADSSLQPENLMQLQTAINGQLVQPEQAQPSSGITPTRASEAIEGLDAPERAKSGTEALATRQ